jgi:hypothetical protein
VHILLTPDSAYAVAVPEMTEKWQSNGPRPGYLGRMTLGYLDPGSGSIMVQSLFGLLVWILPALLVAKYAQNKGKSFALYLFVGLFLSFVIALLVLLVDLSGDEKAAVAPSGTSEQS